MKFYYVEGTLLDVSKMNEDIMNTHKAYTQKAMNDGMIFLSGLKHDQSGAIFIMRASDTQDIQSYLTHEPFYLHGIQTYTIKEFDAHYVSDCMDWFK